MSTGDKKPAIISVSGAPKTPVYPDEIETTTASEDFKENILSHKRYIDKTLVLVPLLRRSHETTFLLRPRRFGKTLTLSMIRYFAEDTRDESVNMENRALFNGMNILSAGAFYAGQMTAYPVINLTLQGVKGEDFPMAYRSLLFAIQGEYIRHRYVLDSDRLIDAEKEYFQSVLDSTSQKRQTPFPKADAAVSLLKLSEFLRKVHGKKAVVLIDEYDVPLEKAWQGGYYREMAAVISPLLQNVLKTNSSNLQFAVVTGCLRVAKESIYTGLNNPEISTVLSENLSTAIGFTEEETRLLLAESGFPDHFQEVREWYDGYCFGSSRIYNPWSVIRHIEKLTENPSAKPGPHWAGTSENAIIRELAAKGSLEVREKAERVIRLETITFAARDNIVYSELDYHDDNVFNVLLHAGYLTVESQEGGTITARIPNREIRELFESQIREWFTGHAKSFDVQRLYSAMAAGDARLVREILVEQYLASMSYYDTQEAYYHGVLLALLSQNVAFRVTSNRESGSGRFDLQCEERVRQNTVYLLEVKVSKTQKAMTKDAERASRQAKAKKYAVDALMDGYGTVLVYGIAFYQKDCRVCAGGVYRQTDLKELMTK